MLSLALALTARGLLDLGLVLAAGPGAGSLGSGFLAGGALDLLALNLVGDSSRVCQCGGFLSKVLTTSLSERSRLHRFAVELQ